MKIMFLCTGNSCRSQMAEGFAKEMGGDNIEAYSAGLFPVGINPYAIKVMREEGIDISVQTSDAIDPELLDRMDIIITLCGNAEAQCPATPSHIKKFHWPIKDPVGATGTEDDILAEFRKARDIIREKVGSFIKSIKNPSS